MRKLETARGLLHDLGVVDKASFRALIQRLDAGLSEVAKVTAARVACERQYELGEVAYLAAQRLNKVLLVY